MIHAVTRRMLTLAVVAGLSVAVAAQDEDDGLNQVRRDQGRMSLRLQSLREKMERLSERYAAEGRQRNAELLQEAMGRFDASALLEQSREAEQALQSARLSSVEQQDQLVTGLESVYAVLRDRRDVDDLRETTSLLDEGLSELERLATEQRRLLSQTRSSADTPAELLDEALSEVQRIASALEQAAQAAELGEQAEGVLGEAAMARWLADQQRALASTEGVTPAQQQELTLALQQLLARLDSPLDATGAPELMGSAQTQRDAARAAGEAAREAMQRAAAQLAGGDSQPGDQSGDPTGDPTAGQPSVGQPNAGEPNAGQPNAGQPSAGQPSAGQPSEPQSGAPTGGDSPSGQPSGDPSGDPSGEPSGDPSGEPSGDPSGDPSGEPSGDPQAGQPSGAQSSGDPSGEAGGDPSGQQPSGQPGGQQPSGQPPGEPRTPSEGETLPQPQTAQEQMERAADLLDEMRDALVDAERAANAARNRALATAGAAARQAESQAEDLNETAQRLETAEPEAGPELLDRTRELMARMSSAEQAREQGDRSGSQAGMQQAQSDLEAIRKMLQQRRQDAGDQPAEQLTADQRAEAVAQQQELERRLRELMARLEELPDQGFQEPSDQAQQAMGGAEQALERGDDREAAQRQEEAAEKLEEARQELEGERDRYEQLRQDEVLFRLAEELKTLLDEQVDLTGETAQLHEERGDSERLSRSQRRALARLGDDQRRLSDRTRSVSDTLKQDGAVAFVFAIDEAAGDMAAAADRLGEQETGRVVASLQQGAGIRLSDLLAVLDQEMERRREAMQQDQGEPPPDQQQPQGPAPLVPPVAELLLVQRMELMALARVESFQRELGEQGELGPRDAVLLERWANEHARVTELFRSLIPDQATEVQLPDEGGAAIELPGPDAPEPDAPGPDDPEDQR